MTLQRKMTPCQSREAVITVLSYQNGIMSAYLQHPRLEGREKIESLSQMLLLLNGLLDLEHCLDRPLSLVQDECSRKSIAVFRIQILFREHYTWQGRLIWQDEKQEYVFRSAVELMQLLDEILAE